MTIDSFRELTRKALFRTFPPGILIALLIISASIALAADVQDPDGDAAESLSKQACKQIKRGDLDGAEKLLKRALDISPKNTNVKVTLAYWFIKKRRWGEAYDLSFDAAKTEPKNARAYAVLGLSLLNGGRFQEAKAILNHAYSLNRREPLVFAGMGMLDFYENRIDSSLTNLQNAVFLDPTDADFVFALAQVSARAEKYKEAADAYNIFLTISDKSDKDRRDRIKGLIEFLRYLGQKESLYVAAGDDSTSVPITIVGNRPILELRVNDSAEPLKFVLDTGSGISVISNKTASLLKLKPVARGGFAKGIGGDGKFEIVYGFLRQIGIGGVKVRNVPVYIREFHNTNENIDGYIGLSLISKFLTTLDYGNRTFDLRKRSDDGPQTTADTVSLPLRLTSSGFLSGEVQLEGVENPLNFIVDTGASVSVISDDVAVMDKVSHFVREEKLRVIGSAGVTEDVPTFLLPKLSFGAHTRRSITAIALDLNLINEASGFEQSGILGGNFLKNYRLTFDFKNSKVTFVPIAQEQ